MVETATIAPSDYPVLIKQGITDAKGSVEEALALLTADDLTNLGRTLSDRAARIGDLFSAVVNPINTASEALAKGKYDGQYDWISDKNTPFPQAEGAKRIYFVPVTETVKQGGEETYVRKFGLTLCKKAPCYLAGAMAEIPESELPESLQGKDFVAAENDTASVFLYGDGGRCFLCVSRREGGRGLHLVDLDGGWFADDGWVFLAEKP